MKINGELVMIHKNAGLLDQASVKMSAIPHKPFFGKELILNNNSVIINNNVVDGDQVAGAHVAHDDSNDANNNDYLGHRGDSAFFKCPVCQLDDFPNHEVLDDHVKYQHPVYKPTCENCGEVFTSVKTLAVHSAMHVNEKCAIRNSELSMKILNYLENKNVLYQKLAGPIETSQTYRCNFCHDHFTGPQFMVHWKQCKQFKTAEELRVDKRDDSEPEEGKSNFLAGLNLQSAVDSRTSSDCESNLSPLKKDCESTTRLMDAMQSASAFPKHPMFFVEEEKNLDDDDDPFKVEVRDMKRRGEFPCRICDKVFRNLRALKGHARIHISSNRGIRPYECNICTFSTPDKSVVIRHIRNHNGDHPYKCQLCFSTFTTKANCERHLRNAHRKTSRDDIKKLLVDLNSKPQSNQSFKTKLQTLLTGNVVKSKTDEPNAVPKFVGSAFYKKGPCENGEEEPKLMQSLREHRSDVEDSSTSNDSNNNTNSATRVAKKFDEFSLKPLLKPELKPYTNFQIAGLLDMSMSVPKSQFYEGNYKAYNDVIMNTGLIPPAVRDNGMTKVPLGYGSHFVQPESDVDEPLDLSVDVLDLSKKRNGVGSEFAAEDLSVKSQDLSVKSREVEETHQSKSQPPLPYFPKNNIPYGTPFPPNLSSFFVAKNDMSAFPRAKIDPEEEAEPVMLPFQSAKIQPLFFGRLVADAAERYEEMRANISVFADRNKTLDTNDKESEEKLVSEQKFKDAPKSRGSKSSTVKMVMKDGVLVEKQKQRRYRTEKPFSCAYCAGRFTLRSNMDRHVKQQHPGFWRQRQRGGPNRLQRKSKDECEETTMNTSVDSQTGAGETTSDFEMTTTTTTPTVQSTDKRSFESDAEVDDEDNRSAKRLCVNTTYEDDDDEEELIIDEESQDPENDERSEQSTTTTPGKETRPKEENPDLASVRSLLDNVSTQTFSQYFRSDEDPNGKHGDGSEEDEEGLVADSSSEGNGSGGEEKSVSDLSVKTCDKNADGVKKKKSAYSSAPNRVHCDFCYRSFPWASSLRRHTLTHTGQKPYKCSNCPLLFTTKSNCDRHFLRKHRNPQNESQPTAVVNVTLASVDAADRSSSSRLIPNFSTRNVPERPFKCSNCPSSTFSTFQNLKKHIVEKHNQADARSEEVAATSASLFDSQQMKSNKKEENANASDNDLSEKSFTDERDTKSAPLATYEQNFCGHVSSDLPFKCHLCDRSFGERQEALDHMGESHSVEFQHLLYKGALDMNVKLEDAVNHEDGAFSNAVHSDENNAEQKGKFPDYSSRKVICAFCLRRFWSAEDLRRHMRTHTGERPFACDICQRRFTLKHSMLRHRKKHSNNTFTSTSGDNSPNTDDEEPSSPYSDNRELKALPFAADRKVAEMSSGAAVTASVSSKRANDFEPSEGKQELAMTGMFFRDADKETGSKMCNKMITEDGVDLIAKLLDIEDKELVDEMLTSRSADDVAKLLGVQK